MRVLLSALHQKTNFTPLALLYLKAFLLQDKSLAERVDIEIKEFSIYQTDDFILHQIEQCRPEVIGFSCYIWNIGRILDLLSDIKKINKNIKTVLGGPQVSPIAQALLAQHQQIDFIVKGEGEVPFLKLTRALLDSGKGLDKISGLAFRDKGKIVDNAEETPIADLDSLPPVYRLNLINLEDRSLCLETQRGCVFKCHFCYYHKGFDRVRFFGMERVKQDLAFLLAKKPASIYLMDPVFNINLDRAKEICRFIAQNNKNNILLHTEIRAELVDEELAELLNQANIKYLEIGLQSSGAETLRLNNRQLNIEKFVQGIKLLNKYDLITELQLIVGLPGDTFGSFKKSLEFVLGLRPKRVRIARLQVLPGTAIWKRAEELGIVYEQNPPHYFLKSRSFSFSDAVRTQKIINSLDLFGERMMTEYLCKESNISLTDFIDLWIDWNKDESVLLNQTEGLKERFKEFLRSFCEKHKIDFNFYDLLWQKEEKAGFAVRKGKELIEALDKRTYGK